MVDPQTAATLMIARETGAGIECFLLRRSPRSSFMPDVFVFPGGRVEPQDAEPLAQARIRGAVHAADPIHVFAAIRETFEESGLLFCTGSIEEQRLSTARQAVLSRQQSFSEMLAELDCAVDADALRYFSRWVTPPSERRRFDTHFFVARAPLGQIACADASETLDGIWIAPADALARSSAGDFALMFPTIKHLERLCAFDRVADLLDYAARKAIHRVMPDPGPGAEYFVPAALEGRW